MRAHRLLVIAEQLDELRGVSAPAVDDASRLVEALDTGAAATYFFRGDYSNTAWLQPLAEVGAFQKYARVRLGRARRWVIFRELAAYLHRVAAAEPQQVADILASLTTTDSWVTGQLMKATLALPEEQAARVVPQFAKWCRPNNPFAREDEVVELAQRMLTSGHTEAFATLLGLLLEPVLAHGGSDVSGIFFGDRLVDFVQGQYQDFRSAAPLACLRVAERALRSAIPLRARATEERWRSLGREHRRPDPSSGLRAAIEEHEQNRYPDFEDGLVVAVRDALAAFVNQSTTEAEEIVRRYLRGKWSVSRRLALHTLAENVNAYSGLARATALRRQFFHDRDLHHEYWRLVRAVFDRLSGRQQQRLLAWIEQGYEDDDERDRNWFAYRRLKMLEGCQLPARSRTLLEQFATELGEVEHPDFLVYWSPSEGGWVSPTPPADLAAMTVDELYAFLDSWRPPEGMSRPFGPSYAGVGQELRRIVKAEPAKHLNLVDRMAGDVAARMADDTKRYWATYVGYTLDAYEDVCREGQRLDWPKVLALADSAVPGDVPPADWPDPAPGDDDVPELGYDWSAVRHAVAHLIEDGLNTDKPGAIPDDQLPRVRDILVRLARDPFPAPQWEQGREQQARETPSASPMDWHGVSINANRPEAAHVLIRYAIRHGNQIVQRGSIGDRLEPEVRAALTALAADPCRSVHAALGSHLDLLWWLGSEWAEGLLSRVLPDGSESAELWEAGWTAYLRYGRLNRNMHDRLASHYQRSIRECADLTEDHPHLVGLCKHLAAIYTWGWEELDDANALTVQFYATAGDDAACELAQALGYFARNPETAGEHDAEQWQRIDALLKWRLQQVSQDTARHIKELRAFATWLDAVLARGSDLAGMADALQVITSVPLGHWQFERVVEFLDAKAEAHPQMAAQLLRRMLSNCERDAWYWERDKMNSVLDKVFASHDPGAHRDAVKVIELLWEEGEWEPFVQHRDQVERLAGTAR